jgi:hypothetical protein
VNSGRRGGGSAGVQRVERGADFLRQGRVHRSLDDLERSGERGEGEARVNEAQRPMASNAARSTSDSACPRQ